MADYIKGLGGGWRLPTKAELTELRKSGGASAVEFLGKVGFSGVQASCYWASDGGHHGSEWCITMANKRDDGSLIVDPSAMSRESDEVHVWPVKN